MKFNHQQLTFSLNCSHSASLREFIKYRWNKSIKKLFTACGIMTTLFLPYEVYMNKLEIKIPHLPLTVARMNKV